jgi:hypothetical protein
MIVVNACQPATQIDRDHENVLGGVLTRLRREVTKPAEDLHPDPPLQLGRPRHDLRQPRVERLAVLLEAQHEGLMVEARGQEAHPVRVGADQVGQEGLRVPDRVAQPVHLAELGPGVHRPGQHGHRVAVAEQVGVRADLLHVLGQRHHHRDGPQATEDPADAQRVPDRLAHPVPGRDVEVGPGGGVPAHLDLVDHVVGPGQRRAPVGGGGHLRIAAGLGGDPAGQPLGVRQPFGADVIQRRCRRPWNSG